MELRMNKFNFIRLNVMAVIVVTLFSTPALADTVQYCTVTTGGDYTSDSDSNRSGYLRYWLEEVVDNSINQCAPPSNLDDAALFDDMVLFETEELPSSIKLKTVKLKKDSIDVRNLNRTVVVGNWTPDMLTDSSSDINYANIDGGTDTANDDYQDITKDYGLVVIDANTNFASGDQPFRCTAGEKPVYLRNVILHTNHVNEADLNCVADAGAFDVCPDQLIDESDVESGANVPFIRGGYACVLTDGDGDGVTVDDGDCDDNDPNVNPNAEEVCGDDIDNDCDGRIDEGCQTIPLLDFDKDDDGYYWFPAGFGGDCNDNDASINPGAEDASCDGIDQNCDDTDGVVEICTDTVDNDCDALVDDLDVLDCPAAAVEICDDLIDNDGDGLIDALDVLDCPATSLDNDDDGDGYCDDASADGLCDDGTLVGDCDDADASINPNGTDSCADGIDQNCDGIDSTVSCELETLCDGLDDDADGVIDEGYPDVDADGTADCVDVETCDGVDNNGDGFIDEACLDSDGDGVADDIDENSDRCDDGIDNDADGLIDCDDEECTTSTNCNDLPIEEVCNDGADNDGDGSTDCDDSDCAATAVCTAGDLESACDGLDNDVDGFVDEGYTDTDADGTADCMDIEICDGLDNDGDGFSDNGFDTNGDGVSDCVEVGTANCTDGLDNDLDGITDCQDASCESVSACNCEFRGDDCPLEVCNDGLDNDTDGVLDCDDGDCVTDTNCVDQDLDDDGFTVSEGDCDDSNAAVNPSATESCDDQIDNDCDQETNEGCTTGDGEIDNDGDQYCEDTDGDGLCADGTLSGDCDDSDAGVNPGAEEDTDETSGVCADDIDQNCDGIDAVCQGTVVPAGSGALVGSGCGCDLKAAKAPQSVPATQAVMGMIPLALLLILRARKRQA